jgi:hypothetical protein
MASKTFLSCRISEKPHRMNSKHVANALIGLCLIALVALAARDAPSNSCEHAKSGARALAAN